MVFWRSLFIATSVIILVCFFVAYSARYMLRTIEVSKMTEKRRLKYTHKKTTIISLYSTFEMVFDWRNDFKYECHAAPHDNECLIMLMYVINVFCWVFCLLWVFGSNVCLILFSFFGVLFIKGVQKKWMIRLFILLCVFFVLGERKESKSELTCVRRALCVKKLTLELLSESWNDFWTHF